MSNETKSGVTISIGLDPAHMHEVIDTALTVDSVWIMLQKIASDYTDDDLMDAFGENCLSDMIADQPLSWIYDKFKKYEADRHEIHKGDEVTWEYPYPIYGITTGQVRESASKNPRVYTGIVIGFTKSPNKSITGYRILTCDLPDRGLYATYVPVDRSKTYNFHKTGYRIREMREDKDGTENS